MERRSFLRGLVGLIAAPAIVQVASIMPVSVPRYVGLDEFGYSGFEPLNISMDDVLLAGQYDWTKIMENAMAHNALLRRFTDWEAGKVAAGTWRA